jgi:hypothetical protein
MPRPRASTLGMGSKPPRYLGMGGNRFGARFLPPTYADSLGISYTGKSRVKSVSPTPSQEEGGRGDPIGSYRILQDLIGSYRILWITGSTAARLLGCNSADRRAILAQGRSPPRQTHQRWELGDYFRLTHRPPSSTTRWRGSWRSHRLNARTNTKKVWMNGTKSL